MSDVCPKCGRAHRVFEGTGQFLDKEDLAEIRLIINAEANARQALDPRNIPEGAPQGQVDKFVAANVKILSAYQVFEKEFWQKILGKIAVDPNTDYSVNLDTGELTACHG